MLAVIFGVSAGVIFVFDNDFFSSNDIYEEFVNSDESVFWMERIREKGGQKAYKDFAQIYLDLPNTKQHEKAHIFGEALYKTEGISGIVVCDSNYGFCCYHSFFGWALSENGLEIMDKLDKACIETYGNKGLGCQHGIGHGVLVELGRDNLGQALEECGELNWKGPIGGCSSGVFMEYNFRTIDQGARRPLSEEGEYFPCDVVARKFKEACYFEQPAWWAAQYLNDYSVVGRFCDELTELSHSQACFRGIGNVIAGNNGYNIPEISNQCANMPDFETELLCIEGATWIVSNQQEYENTWRQLCEPYEGEYLERCLGSYYFI